MYSLVCTADYTSSSKTSSDHLSQVLDNCIEAEEIINRYEALASDLLDWIEKTIAVISNQKFANSLTGVQQQLQAFTTYCTIEKPIKYVFHPVYTLMNECSCISIQIFK